MFTQIQLFKLAKPIHAYKYVKFARIAMFIVQVPENVKIFADLVYKIGQSYM